MWEYKVNSKTHCGIANLLTKHTHIITHSNSCNPYQRLNFFSWPKFFLDYQNTIVDLDLIIFLFEWPETYCIVRSAVITQAVFFSSSDI